MTPEERQSALDNISPEELQKIQKAQRLTIEVEPEDYILAEFAMKFGWQAYMDVKNDLVTSNEMNRLIAASRKIDALQMLRQAQSVFIGAGSAQSKKPSQTFTSLTKKLAREAEV